MTSRTTTTEKHDCVDRLNGKLAEFNTRLPFAISFDEPSREMIRVSTVKAKEDVRKKPMALYASFCPFCGVNLRAKDV